jgi:hypothetical protein
VGRAAKEMTSEYEKELEVRNEVLASLLTKQVPGEVMYIVDPKPEMVLSNGNGYVQGQSCRLFYATLAEAIISWGRDKYTTPYITGTYKDELDAVKKYMDVYEYNIRTGTKTKVFG